MEGGQSGGQSEFRRANIVYFLSRNGTVEHPHIVRVHHLHCNGVHLRDVKRWLGELRGKCMPDSFAWSYKRRYKSGYVWQDLKDDDLITPISDNEYVLKGSLLQLHSINGFLSDRNSEKEAETAVAVAGRQVVPVPKSEPETLRIEQDIDNVVPTEPPQPEPDGGTLTKSDSSDRRMAVVRIAKKQEEREQQRFKSSYSSCASHVLRNILRCGAADANDSVLMPISGGSRGGHHRRSTSDVPRQQHHHQQGSETDNNSRKSRRSASKNGGSSASYKPLGAPNCSQCGRPFDPEKLHSHMQSCRALRGGGGKGRISTDRVPLRREPRSEDDISRGSISGHLT